MTIADLARRGVVTARPEATVRELATQMRDQNVGCVVITEGDHPVGIVTDRDVVVDVVGADLDPGELTAADVMADEPETARASDGVMAVTERMREAGVRRMPVVEDGSLVGIVTLDDLFRLLVEELDNLTAVVEAESPPY